MSVHLTKPLCAHCCGPLLFAGASCTRCSFPGYGNPPAFVPAEPMACEFSDSDSRYCHADATHVLHMSPDVWEDAEMFVLCADHAAEGQRSLRRGIAVLPIAAA